MNKWVKFIAPIALSLPLIWLNFYQSMKLKEALKLEVETQQKFDELNAISRQQDEIRSLQRDEKELVSKVQQLVYLYVKQELPILSDCMQGEKMIVVRSYSSDYLDIRLWLPKEKRVSLHIQKIEGAVGKILKIEDFLKVDFDDAGWHSITTKIEKMESGSRLPLLVDGREIYSIDLKDRKWQGGCSYSPGNLPRAFQLKPLEDSTVHSINQRWTLLFQQNAERFGYDITSLNFKKSKSEASVILEQEAR